MTQLTIGLTRLGYSRPDVAEHLAWAADHDRTSGVAHAGVTTLRRVDLGAWGQVTCQVADHTSDWRARVEKLCEPLIRFGGELDVAFVRHSPYWVSSWIDLDAVEPPLPLVTEAKVRRNRRLLARYVPDAHGLQVLTEDHLSRLLASRLGRDSTGGREPPGRSA